MAILKMINSIAFSCMLFILFGCTFNLQKCNSYSGRWINLKDKSIIIEINQSDYKLIKDNKRVGGGYFDIQGNNIRFFKFNLKCNDLTKKHIAMGNIFGCKLIFNEDEPNCNFVKL